jgi:predicted CXXCH cytochrome family protein
MERKLRDGLGVAAAMAVLALMLLQPFGGDAFAAKEQKETCVTGECHAGMGKGAAFVHAPVSSGDCLSCHIKTGKHKFQRITNVGKMCNECHERLDVQTVVHDPVKKGRCTLCHDPHQSPYKFQLRASGGDLCIMCHGKGYVTGKFVHGPAAVGSCSTCHYMHQSQYPKLLIAAGNDLCFGCHGDKVELLKSKKNVHRPVKEKCVACHDPHGGDFKYNFKVDGEQDLCFGCHKDKLKEAKEMASHHKALDGPRKCLACHDAHASDFSKQLTRQPGDLCISCHDREYSNNGIVQTANIKQIVTKNKFAHGPILQNDCSGCHNAHGSPNIRLLREYFPQLFYAQYNPDNYKLCFMCHEQNLAAEETTTTLTGFRNGDKNLHFVHVNKVKGRTCRACHDAHATNNPRHVRDAVPFAKWQLPVGFTKTETGGKCLPGCHQLFAYDRQKRIENKPDLTGTRRPIIGGSTEGEKK